MQPHLLAGRAQRSLLVAALAFGTLGAPIYPSKPSRGG